MKHTPTALWLFLTLCTFFSLAPSPAHAQVPTWSTATAPAGAIETLDAVAYNGSKFLAAGVDLRVLSSTDGINWTNNGRMASATVVTAFGVAWIPFLNLWVAGTNVNLNTDALIYTSPDGLTWTPRSTGLASTTVQSFATDGSKVIGTVGNGGRVIKSTNGTTWTLQSVGVITSSLFDIIYAGGQFMAVGGTGGIITSPDGVTWTKRTAPSNITGIIRSVAYGNGRYVLVANAVGQAGWSTDGITWNNSSTGLATGLTKLTFVNGVFVGVGPSGTISTSTDGVTWTAAHTSGTTENILDVIANGTGSTARVVAVGGNTTTVLRHILASDLNTPSGPVAPSVSTATQNSVTHNSATLGGNVTADGGANVTERGIVWGTSANPTTANNKVANGSGTGTFSATVNGLPSNTLVHVRAYATNSVDTSYGNDVSFTTLPAPIAVTSLVRANTSPTNAATVNWTLTFASAVTGLTASNFSLTGTATGGTVGTPAIASGGGLTWTIPVTTGATDGTLTLNLANATGLSSAISTSLPYAGESYTIDKTAPTVVSITRLTPTGQNTNLTTLTFRVTYSEPVTLTAPETSHFQVVPVNSSTIVGTVTGVTGTGNTRDVTVNLTSGVGEFTLRVVD